MATTMVAPALFAESASDLRDITESSEPGFSSEFYDDPDADYEDDGSRVIKLSPTAEAPETLIPLSPIEESGLLGDWGDSLDEDED